jgi:hypothetical protein
MSKARDLGDLLDTDGDVVSDSLDNVPTPSKNSIEELDIALPAANITGTLEGARLPSNISDTGTVGTKVATGTTAQRGSTTGEWRYNTTLGYFEGRHQDGSFFSLQPEIKVTSVDVTEVDSTAGGNVTIIVTGEYFTSGGTIAFVGTNAEFNADTSTFNSGTEYTAVKTKASFLNAQEPYKVKFTSATGRVGISSLGLINVDSAPTWTTSAGNLATIYDGVDQTHATVAASDTEGDTIAYTETGGTNVTGAGLVLNSSTGVISGNPNDVTSDTTVSFTLRATANTKTADRAFNIIVRQLLDGTTESRRAYSTQDLLNAGVSSGTKWVDIHGTAVQMEYNSADKFSTGVSGWLKFDNTFMDSNGGSISGEAYSSGGGNAASWDSGYEGWSIGNHSSQTGSTGIGHVRMKMPRLRYARIVNLTGNNTGSQTADDGNVESQVFYTNNNGANMFSYAISRTPTMPNADGYPVSIYNTNISNSWDNTNKSNGSTGNLINPYPGGLFGAGGSRTKTQNDFSMTSFSSFDTTGVMWFSSWSGDSGAEKIAFTNFEMWIH